MFGVSVATLEGCSGRAEGQCFVAHIQHITTTSSNEITFYVAHLIRVIVLNLEFKRVCSWICTNRSHGEMKRLFLQSYRSTAELFVSDLFSAQI